MSEDSLMCFGDAEHFPTPVVEVGRAFMWSHRNLRDLKKKKKKGLVMENCLLGLESKQLYLDGEMHWGLSELKDVTLERLIFTGRAQSMC